MREPQKKSEPKFPLKAPWEEADLRYAGEPGLNDAAAPSGRSIDRLDSELVLRIREGEQRAKAVFYERHVRAVMATVIRLLGRRAEAADVVQETFTHAFAEIAQLRDPSAARAWLLKIALRRIHRVFRRRKLLRMLGMDAGAADATLEQLAARDAGPELRAELSMIDRFVSTLPASQRTPWMLHVVEGLSLEEVARLEDCSLATVKRRLRKANERLTRHVRGGRTR